MPNCNGGNNIMKEFRFDCPQIKRNLISNIINFVWELSHELPIDLGLKILGNQEI